MDWLQFLDLIAIPLSALVVGFFYNRYVKHENKMDELQKNVDEWKLMVVQTYATKQELEKMETRILSSLDRMEGKLERVLARYPGHAD